jgi:hypothetical protein
MQATVNLMFGIHAHQPVGNFEGVFQRAYEQCYHPFLITLARHPIIRAALHFSGSLLEWIEEHNPEYIDLIARLAERGQIELMSGGFYEPLLPIIPRGDALGQIQMMNEYILRRFGQKARGLWLAERVWEPQLPSLIADVGLEYTLVDDTHFLYAGMQSDEAFGYYLTEDNGKKLAIFPIDKKLRYYIPFKLPEDTIFYLREVSGKGEQGISYGDDAEKFGVWPETYKWVYEEKYLEHLFSQIEENSSWIKMPTFSEYLDAAPPMGRVYLPTASYDEMMEWALPAESSLHFLEVLKKLKKERDFPFYQPFLRGGFWRNFLAKYPEANRLHKKMLHVSRKVNASGAQKAGEAKRELWRGQCNCPYWHGLFGGLYLNYLRYANYHHLLKAEQLVEPGTEEIHVEQLDYDCDGYDELLLTSPTYSIAITPGYGGSLAEISFRPKAFNLTDVMSRHKEAYHQKIAEAPADAAQGQVQSIHNLVRAKEKGLESLLQYDRYDRRAFQDHFLDWKTILADFAAANYYEEGDFIDQPYQVVETKSAQKKVAFTLKREGRLLRPEVSFPLLLEKTYTISSEAGIETTYFIQCGEKPVGNTLFAVELNLTLLAGDAEDRYYEIPGRQLDDKCMNSFDLTNKVSSVRLVDRWMNIVAIIDFEPEADLWRFPVRTVSQSESGFERTYQGSCVVAVWPLMLDAGDTVERTVNLRVEDL